MSIQRTVTVSITPEEMAADFSHMGDDEQVRFFNELANITSEWERPFCFQLQCVTDNPDLTEEAREIMSEIGAYARPVID